MNALTTDRHKGIEPFGHVFFVLVWLALLAWMVVSCSVTRREAGTVIRQTAEYRCLADALGKDIPIKWASIVKPHGPNRSYPAGMLFDRYGTGCIPDGDAVTFAIVPSSDGNVLIRIRGREVETEFRERGMWADIVGAGHQRWRNDGNGYRSIGD